MPGKRIKDLTPLSGAGSANNDDVVIFDADADATKRISRSQLAEGMQGDVQVFSNKTINLGSNTLTGTTAQFNTALSDNNFATQAGSETLTNKTIDSANNTLTVNYKEARVETSDASRTHLFTTVAALLADTGTYTTYAAGQIVEAGGFRYEVAASGALDQHVTTAGGVKLYVLPQDGWRHVNAFGALGDGVADDGAEINAAFAAAPSAGVKFGPGTYKTSVKIQTQGRSFMGSGLTSCSIIPASAMATMVEIGGQSPTGSGIYFNGSSLADVCVEFTGANSCILENFRAEGGKIDGVRFALTGNNNNVCLEGALIRNNGTTYTTGTAAITNGSGTVIFSDLGVDLTTLFSGTRCFLHVSGQEVREVTAVSASSVTVLPVFAATTSGLTYSLEMGANIYVSPQGNNSEIKVSHCTLQSAPVGIDDRSLYGVKGDGNVIEFCKIGRAVNRLQDGGSLTRGGTENNAYFEGGTVDLYLAGVRGFVCIGGNDDTALNIIQRKSNPFFRYMRGSDVLLTSHTSLVNTSMGSADVGFGTVAAIGAPNKTVILPVPRTDSLKSSHALEYTVITDIQANGYTLVTTSDGSTINGGSGASGVKIYSNKKAVTFRYVPYINDWVYNPTDTAIRGSSAAVGGGGIGAGATATLALSGFDATTATIIAKSQGGGENVAADKWLTEVIVSDRTTTGCNLIVKNLGASGQTIRVDWIIIQ